jgi:hypothetical protein
MGSFATVTDDIRTSKRDSDHRRGSRNMKGFCRKVNTLTIVNELQEIEVQLTKKNN